MSATLRSLLALLLLVGACSCAPSRYERYFTKENAPTTESQGALWQLLYFTQSQRQISALLYVTNRGTEPLVIKRLGTDAATFTLVMEGTKIPADPPLSTIWSPWTGTVERTREEIATQVVSPGQSLQLSLRWQFPLLTKTHTYAWSVIIAGLIHGTTALDPVEVFAPAAQ